MYQSSCIVAAIQFEPKLLDVHRNLATATHLVFEAAAKGAKIVVLPELCLSGYVIQSKQEAASVCQERNGYQTQAFIPLAKTVSAPRIICPPGSFASPILLKFAI